MKGAVIAVVSFALGVACTLVLSREGLVSPVLAQATNISVPVVPPLKGPGFHAYNNTQVGGEYVLDGTETINGLFKDVTFVYGGGAFDLSSSLLDNPKLKLVGAAANTAFLLSKFGFLSDVPPSRNTPIQKTTTKTTIKGDFVSPYDGKP